MVSIRKYCLDVVSLNILLKTDIFTHLKTDKMKTTNNFENYGQLSEHLFNAMGLKVETVYIQDGNYSDYAIYINRIGNCSKPKFRVLKSGIDKVKNCLKITYNPNVWERKYLVYLIEANKNRLAHLSIGTCHRFLRHGIVKEVLTGVWEQSCKLKDFDKVVKHFITA